MPKSEIQKDIISLSDEYYLVVDDKFELFYRGVMKTFDVYRYYVKATCLKGYTYKRYYTFTPKEEDCGEYDLTISLFDEEGYTIDEKTTKIIVLPKTTIKNDVNVLCIGDSLTVNGVWPNVGYERFTLHNSPNNLNFYGKMKKEKVGYEGYGGWQWKTFCEDNQNSTTSAVWVDTIHDLTSYDQHSIWISNGNKWILETITKDKLKFKRAEGNNKVNPALDKTIINVQTNKELVIDKYEYSEGNPFWNKEENKVDFSYYIKTNNYSVMDYVFILLTWNGQYIPYNKDFTIHNKYSQIIIKSIHEAFPKAKIGLIGIQLPCPNGGMTACYHASGYYHDWYGETITAFNYCNFLKELANRDEYKDYVKYFDLKAQFDSEYNYYTKDEKVNARCDEYKERLGVNGIHPAMSGYLQMGDAFYRFLNYMLKDHSI